MAEPAIGDSNSMGFDNTNSVNQNNSVPSGRPFPIPIPTNNTNISVVSAPPTLNLNLSEQTIRQVEDEEGIVQPIRVSNLTLDGSITLYGRYPQNSVDIEKFDLSSINVIYDGDVDFNFILSIKDGVNSIPQLYASKDFYNELVSNYATENPFPVNRVLNPSQIVTVDIAPIKNKIEELRITELNQDINISNIGTKDYVQLNRNLFSFSNYQTDPVTGLKANPTYDISELLKYISWVVAKPPQNYNERVLPASSLGEWGNIEENNVPSTGQPSTQTNTQVDTNNNPTPPPTPTYPPIGRAGTYDEEEVFKNGKLYIWDDDVKAWFEQRPDDRD